ncbi:GIY-YIG nuclease family protein [Bradyrhizobium sp. LB12.1]|uniref:GIY-YIG nuclease family protein n=1 Tax=Bradyrhizobium sp. LB12.1 TaxID=3156327 RepID=UPI00339501B9
MPLSIVYVLTNPAMPGLVKIGRTSYADANTRIAQLYSTGVPFPFRIEFACKVENPDEVESALHVAFAPSRVNLRREFFSIEPEQAIAILRLLHVPDATAEVEQSPSPIEPEEVNAANEFASRRPNLNFEEMGIAAGSILKFSDGEAFVTVVTPKKVRLNEVDMSLTAATRSLLGLDYSVQPAPYWTFNGRSLRDIYNETYPLT